MKKSHQQFALILVAVLAAAYFGKKHMDKKKMTAGSSTAAAAPTSFEIKHPDGNATKFWMDGGKYMRQLTGPAVRSTPVAITQAAFLKASQGTI